MKDNRGHYYYPFPRNKQVRMYVKSDQGEICFRLWNAEDASLWNDHGWVPYDAIRKAEEMYQKKANFDPREAYDIHIAKALLKEDL